MTFEPSDLLVWLDETGQDSLSDPRHPVFGLGGCVIYALHHAKQIDRPWRLLKGTYFGGADVPLHAADLRPTKEQMRALGAFFENNAFLRIAVLVTDRTIHMPDYPRQEIVTTALLIRLRDMLSARGHAPSRVELIVEASQRNRALSNAFRNSVFNVFRNRPPAVRGHFLPKSAGAPGLEVADFIINTAARRAKQSGEERRSRAPKDFEAVFLGKAEEQGLSSFMQIESVAAMVLRAGGE